MIQRLSKRLRASERSAGEAGFTIAEVMVAMMVFAIISVGIAAGIINSLVLTQDGKSRTVAVGLASKRLDEERQQSDIFQVNGSNVTTTSYDTVGNIKYTIVETANWADADGSVNPCGLSGPTTALANKSVDVQVSWSSKSNFGQTSPVRMTALLAPGTDSLDPNSGIIFVGVTNATGTGSAGVTVSIAVNPAGSGTAKALTAQPSVTTSSGCSVARGVTPGDYIVKITRAGGIDYQQQTSPTKSVTVTGGGSTTASFQYDTATKVIPSLGNNGALVPNNLGITYRNAAGDSQVANTGAVNLFPFTDGYRLVTGALTTTPVGAACPDPDPAAWTKGADNKVGVQVPTAASVAGGTATWADSNVTKIPMGTFKADFGIAPSATVTATPTTPPDAGDPGCKTTPAMGYTFDLTSSNQTFALPYGTYTISAKTPIVGGLLGVSFTPTLSSANGSKVTINGGTIMLDPRTASS